jgi:sugar O-acyltransferase (sialic acid O-acetyltransferase NeuD family)
MTDGRQLVIVGGGEHASVVAEAARAAGWEPVGFTDAGDAAAGPPGLPRLGTDAMVVATRAGQPPSEWASLVLGFGGPPEARRRAVATFGPAAAWATVVHPAAWVSPSARLGRGAVVLAGAIVNTGAEVGEHAIVNSGAIIEHDARVGAHAHVAPGATLGGGASVGVDAFVGLGACVRDHVVIGARAVVGMGAVVLGHVADDAVVVGSPAHVTPGVEGRP